jgi:hypothetical protein
MWEKNTLMCGRKLRTSQTTLICISLSLFLSLDSYTLTLLMLFIFNNYKNEKFCNSNFLICVDI